MKSKYIYMLIFALSFIFIGIGPVNAATESLYTYDKTSLDFVDSNYKVTRSSNNIFTLTNSSETVTLDLSDPTLLPAYNGYKIKSIQNIMVYGSTNKIEILIVPLQIQNVSTSQVYSNFQYTVSNTAVKNNFVLSLSNANYPNRRALYFSNNMTISGYPTQLNQHWRYSYSTTTNTWSNVSYPANNNLIMVDASYASIPIYYTDFNIQSCNSTTCVLYYSSDYEAIPKIDVDLSISKKLSNGSYDVSLNILPAKKGWYVEIEDILSGYTTNFTIDSDLLVYTRMFMNIVDNTLYEVKIYNNNTKEILYYQNSFNAILDEDSPHIAIDSFKYNEDKSYTLYYHYENTTANNKCYYTLYDLDWIEQNCSTYTASNQDNYTVQHNGLFGLKIVNNKTSEIVDQYMLNLIPDKTAVYMTFGGTFMINTMSYNFKYNTFNFDITDYLYYSTNGSDWIYLDNFVGYIDFYTPQTLYFKLEDSSHAIKYQTIYELSFNSTGDYSVKDTTNFIEDISYYISNLFDAFMTFYANINSEIKVGIVAVIPMIILCIFIERWRK